MFIWDRKLARFTIEIRVYLTLLTWIFIYVILKVSRNLFRWTKEVAYADYYERALINGVLSIQRGAQPGVMIYMLPMKPDSSKAVSYHGWGTKFDSFWCCYGTGTSIYCSWPLRRFCTFLYNHHFLYGCALYIMDILL